MHYRVHQVNSFCNLENSGPVHTTPEEFENGDLSLWKCIKIVSFHTTPEDLDFCLRKTRAEKSRDYRDVIVFKKAPFSKCFPSTRKRKAGVFKFLRFKERFWKASFSWRIRNKASLSYSCGTVWKELQRKQKVCKGSGNCIVFLSSLKRFGRSFWKSAAKTRRLLSTVNIGKVINTYLS